MTANTASTIRTSLVGAVSALAAIITTRYFFPVEERSGFGYYALLIGAVIVYGLLFNFVVNRGRKPKE